MSVQTTLTSLSRAAASNGPDGATDAPSTLDDQLRYHGQFIAEVRDGAHLYAGSISGTNTITGTISTSPTSYVTGQVYRFIAAGANTGAVTLNLSGIGEKAITKNGTTALTAGDIPSGAAIEVMYDGTQFQLLNVDFTAGYATASGYIKLPRWLGGWIFQFGSATGSNLGDVTITFPTAFSTSIVFIGGNTTLSPGSSDTFVAIGSNTLTYANFGIWKSTGARVVEAFRWLAIGK